MAQRILRHCNCHLVLYTNSQHEDLQNKQALPVLTNITCREATTGPTSKEIGICLLSCGASLHSMWINIGALAADVATISR